MRPTVTWMGSLRCWTQRWSSAPTGASSPRRLQNPPGPRAVANQALAFAQRARSVRPALVNGTAGLVADTDGRLLGVLGFTVNGGKILEIDILADPARLRRFDLPVPPPDTGRRPAAANPPPQPGIARSSSRPSTRAKTGPTSGARAHGAGPPFQPCRCRADDANQWSETMPTPASPPTHPNPWRLPARHGEAVGPQPLELQATPCGGTEPPGGTVTEVMGAPLRPSLHPASRCHASSSGASTSKTHLTVALVMHSTSSAWQPFDRRDLAAPSTHQPINDTAEGARGDPEGRTDWSACTSTRERRRTHRVSRRTTCTPPGVHSG